MCNSHTNRSDAPSDALIFIVVVSYIIQGKAALSLARIQAASYYLLRLPGTGTSNLDAMFERRSMKHFLLIEEDNALHNYLLSKGSERCLNNSAIHQTCCNTTRILKLSIATY